ncbi:integrase [Sphingomonas naasensis]|uniref:Site-specific integrase n=1 Tax=Sphingomonas naasensis TaxID=1344951 RepID=A0A4S1WJQ7_9SPHN|nr:site-specific integrase [Sphingomonas naasensis]NIJ21071.1 integrase [Sphingomonas naasensis]TGX43444.1 site-specific integrase [Sphingomonas naasensis]
MLTTEDLARMVQDFYHAALADENEIRLNSRVTFDEANREAIVAYYGKMGVTTRRNLATNNLASVEPFATDLIEKHGLTGQLNDSDIARVQQAILRAGCDFTEAMKARFEGDFSYSPQDPLLSMMLDAPVPVVPRAGAKDHEPEAIGPLFSERAEEFRKSQIRLDAWENQSGLQARKTYELFEEVCGNRPLSGYLRADAARFKEVLQHLPANYGKAAAYRGKTATEIIELTQGDDNIQLLSGRTVQRHFSALSKLWVNAVDLGEASENIFEKFKFAASKRARDQRQMWESDQLQALFNTPIWRGCHSKDRRSRPGQHVIRDERFWLPLVAVFSGMRQEEICQHLVEDIRQQDGIWLFDINARNGQQLKNSNAIRLVPIHKELIRIGFLDYVEQQRKAGHTMLFDQLERGGADGRFGHNYSKYFTRYRRDVGLYQKSLDFHSLRHSATTFLQRGEVHPTVVDRLTAHETQGETARYTKDFPLAQLKDAIDKIDIKVDLSFLAT